MAQEEIFGPVLSVFKYDDLNDAVEKSNDSDFGLASYVWSNDIREAHDLAHRIESGNVLLILTDINQRYHSEDIKKVALEENTVLRQC